MADVMNGYKTVVDQVEHFVSELFRTHEDRDLPFHSFQHTLEVVDAARTIAREMELSYDEVEIVTLAAWLHDVGYFYTYRGHEEKSAEIAKDVLDRLDYGKKNIKRVVGCILATKVPQQPANILEQIVCDADMSHLAEPDVAERAERLRKEWSDHVNEVVTDVEWMEQNLSFMQEHRYFTSFAQQTFGPRLDRHMNALENAIDAMKNDGVEREPNEQGERDEKRGKKIKLKNLDTVERVTVQENEQIQERTKKLKKLKDKLEKLEGQITDEMSPAEIQTIHSSAARHDRGIETMFRSTSRNHIDLSSMADSKANILISVNSIIISIVASLLIRNLTTSQHLILPTAMLVVVCLSTIVTAILATRPKVSSGTFTQEDIDNKKVNLLFFGNFHGVSIEDYEKGMYAMMRDPDYLYGSLIKDIYYLGNVLGKKYRYLRISYNIFMYGLIVSVVAFIVASILAEAPTITSAPTL